MEKFRDPVNGKKLNSAGDWRKDAIGEVYRFDQARSIHKALVKEREPSEKRDSCKRHLEERRSDRGLH